MTAADGPTNGALSPASDAARDGRRVEPAMLVSVLTRWHAHPSIAQGDVQSLLRAITSQKKIYALSDHLKSVAGPHLLPNLGLDKRTLSRPRTL